MATQVVPTFSIDDARERRCIKRIWFVALITAVVAAIPVTIFKDHLPWLIGVPICFGTLVALGIEIWEEAKPFVASTLYGRILGPASGLPPDFAGLQNYPHVILQIRDPAEAQGQELFSFLESRAEPTRKPRKVRLANGEEICIVGAERFVELLVDRLLKDSDAVVEHAITMGAIRFGGSGRLSKTILDTIQSDFRGNWITVVSRDAELVLRQLEQKLKTEEFELKQQTEKTKRRQAPRNA